MSTRQLKHLVLLGWLLLSGCALLPGSRGHWVETLPPFPLQAFPAACQVSGVLSFHQADQTLEFPIELLFSPERMSVVLLSPIGGALTSATLAGDQLTGAGGAALPPALQGENLLHQIQLALWPAASINALLQPRGLVLREQDKLREIWHQQVKWVEIHRAYPDPLQGAVEFSHLTEQYQWTLRIVHQESLESSAP